MASHVMTTLVRLIGALAIIRAASSALWQHAEEKEIRFSFLMDSKHDSARSVSVFAFVRVLYLRRGEQGQPTIAAHALTAGNTNYDQSNSLHPRRILFFIAKSCMIDGAKNEQEKAGLEFTLSLNGSSHKTSNSVPYF